MKKEFIKKNYPLFVGFFVPVTIMLGYFIYRGMYPFGKSSLLTVDLGQQYVDFFAAYRDTLLHDPTKIFYSFSKAIGGEMLGEFAYYLLSPFNLIFLFFKGKTLTAGIMLVTLLKYGCSGLAMAWLLQKRNKKTRLVNSALAVTYAMMGWFVANQFNLLWLDACVFLPLIIVGFYNLMETAKPACYVLFLGLMIIINYYMAYMICIFLVLFFIWYAFDNFETPKIMLKKAAIFVGSSLLAVGVGSLTLLSTLYTLSVSKGQYMQEKISFKLEYNPIKMVSKLTMGAFNFDQLPSGQPNLFISSLALFAFCLFFFCKKIKLRSRITAFLITCFLILSMCFEPLDLFWHGMQFPVWYPYRFSFIVSFWMIFLAHTALSKRSRQTRIFLTVPGILYAGVIIYVAINLKKFSFASKQTLIISAVFALLTLILMSLPDKLLDFDSKDFLLLIVVIFEMSINACMSLNNLSYLTQKEFADPTKTLAQDKKALDSLDKSLYRVDSLYCRTKNDGLAQNMNFGSYFSSALEKSIPDFYGQIGNPDGDNYVAYTNGTLITDGLLDMKYLIQPKDSAEIEQPKTDLNVVSERPDAAEYNLVKETESTRIYRNPYSANIIYASNRALLNQKILYNDPINYQTSWLNSATSTWPSTRYFYPCNFNEVIFQNTPKQVNLTNSSFKKIKRSKEAKIIFKFTPKTYDSYYVTLGPCLNSDNVTWYRGNRLLNHYGTFRHTVVINVANHDKGNEIVLTARFKKDSLWLNNFVLYQLDTQAVLNKLEQVKINSLTSMKATSTLIKGNLSLDSNQMMATTIPYNQGWHLTVDGKSTSIIKIQNTFIGAMLSSGKHRIVLKYVPPYLDIGCIVSLLSCALLLVICNFSRLKKRGFV